MFLLNLSLAEFLAILGALSGLVLALYLFDRSRRRQVVPTLRFWVTSQRLVPVTHRRKIQQPLSLILQLIGIALLLLAVAQLRWGTPDRTSRDHVLILDTSAWMGASIGGSTLMDIARSTARSWLRAVPPSDRIMVVRADSLIAPATAFETNRDILLDAIRESRPSSAALNLDRAIAFALRVQKMNARRIGEIVLVASGRVTSEEAETLRTVPKNVRFLRVPDEVENCGLRKIGLRRPAADSDVWEIFISVRNYGLKPQTLPVALQFGNAPAGSRTIKVDPGTEQSVTFEYRTRAAGWLEARLLTKDAFPQDDRAVLELPAQKVLRVTVYSESPELLRPVLAATPRVEAAFLSPSQYQPKPNADILVIDGFRPSSPPQIASLWIEPPPGAAPIPVRATELNTEIKRWRTDHMLGAGLRAAGVQLESAQVYSPAKGDIAVAETDAGPVILARPVDLKTIVMGFHPMRSELRYELTTPLLFANILHWMSPEIFRRWELNAGSVGTVTVPLPNDTDASSVSVVSDGMRPVPFTIEAGMLRFFTGTPSNVRVLTGDREVVYSLTLPEVAEARWDPPKEVLTGIPSSYPAPPASGDLWRWLAVAGASVLLLEWFLFGRGGLVAASSRDAVRAVRLPWIGPRRRNALRRAS
ncbi:MAG: VWA domain-containing protein [Bryobacteraceae bacterium]|nr:VWA domain-containing protein [Bryobacteraceae bacterium]